MSNQSSLLGKDELPLIVPTSDEKNLALVSHVITFVSQFVAPLIIYVIKKDESTFITAHAKESLNFQLTLLLVFIICFVSLIGIFLLWFVGVYAMILIIIATIRASEGKLYRYPFSIKFIK